MLENVLGGGDKVNSLKKQVVFLSIVVLIALTIAIFLIVFVPIYYSKTFKNRSGFAGPLNSLMGSSPVALRGGGKGDIGGAVFQESMSAKPKSKFQNFSDEELSRKIGN